MGYVGNELLLVILCVCDLSCHVIESSSQISHLIPAVDGYFIMIITVGIILSALGDLAQGHVHKPCKEYEDYQGKKEDYHKFHIGDIEKGDTFLLDIIH